VFLFIGADHNTEWLQGRGQTDQGFCDYRRKGVVFGDKPAAHLRNRRRQGRIDQARGRLPRQWHAEEIEFMEELAQRIRLVIERNAAEVQLRELNSTLEARVEARTRELEKAEAARREADMFYRVHFENTPDPLFVVRVEPDGAFIAEQINPAHEAGVGFKLEDIRICGCQRDRSRPPTPHEAIPPS
jgi:PAS domain-containing protein